MLARLLKTQPQTADRRPQTADRSLILTRFLSIAIFLAIAMMTSPFVSIGQTCNNSEERIVNTAPCYDSCSLGIFHHLGVSQGGALCNNALGDGMRLYAYAPFMPMPTIRFSYHKTGIVDCINDRAGRIGIMPEFTTAPNVPNSDVWPVSSGNFQEADVFLVSTSCAKDLLLSTNNANSRIKFLTTPTLGTQAERMTILNNGNVGIGTAAPLNQLQINEIFGFHGGGSSSMVYNAYWTGTEWKTIVEATTPTPPTPAKDFYPTSISMWNGSIGLNIGSSRPTTLTANSTITWKTALQVGYTGNVAIGTEWANSRLEIKGEDHSSSHSALNIIDDNNASLLFVRNDGKVTIGKTYTGSTHTDYLLSVGGKVVCSDLRVRPTSEWPDFVFDANYTLMPLHELEQYVQENKHLPEVPTSAEVEKDGVSVNDMIKVLIKKQEEMTLYMIEMKKQNAELRSKLERLVLPTPTK